MLPHISEPNYLIITLFNYDLAYIRLSCVDMLFPILLREGDFKQANITL